VGCVTRAAKLASRARSSFKLERMRACKCDTTEHTGNGSLCVRGGGGVNMAEGFAATPALAHALLSSTKLWAAAGTRYTDGKRCVVGVLQATRQALSARA
jgi:hypothetical protein